MLGNGKCLDNYMFDISYFVWDRKYVITYASLKNSVEKYQNPKEWVGINT